MVVVCNAVKLVLGEQMKCHESLWKCRVRRSCRKWDERCESELECCDLLCESTVPAGGGRHVGLFLAVPVACAGLVIVG